MSLQPTHSVQIAQLRSPAFYVSNQLGLFI